jgi:hypothetical protein
LPNIKQERRIDGYGGAYDLKGTGVYVQHKVFNTTRCKHFSCQSNPSSPI